MSANSGVKFQPIINCQHLHPHTVIYDALKPHTSRIINMTPALSQSQLSRVYSFVKHTVPSCYYFSPTVPGLTQGGSVLPYRCRVCQGVPSYLSPQKGAEAEKGAP